MMAALNYLIPLVLLSVAHAAKIGKENKNNLNVTHEVFFDIEIKDCDGPGEDYSGRFVVALFGDVVPITTMNFRQLANGFKPGSGKKLSYKNTKIHRIVRDFVIQMGDISNEDGRGGHSIFGDKFNDENFILSHKAAGYVSMANHGKDTNGSQFFILLNKARWLDEKHVVFGKVVSGMDVVRKIGEVPSDANAFPKKQIKIMDCGAKEAKYHLTKEQQESNEDI